MLDRISVGGLLLRLHRFLVGGRGGRLQFECRQCGYSTRSPRHHCPECGAAEMARYEL